MASLEGSRIDQTLRHAFAGAARCSRLSSTLEADQRELQGRGAIDDNGGHLDFLAAGYDTSPPSGNPLGSSVARQASAIAAMTDDHIAMRAGVARTVHDEGIADWFKPGRSRAREMRRALDNMR
jgi:hypothetical protein